MEHTGGPSTTPGRGVRIAALSLGAALAWAGISAAGGQETAAPRTVAVGDLHGDLSQARAVLKLAGVIDDAGRWSGGRAVLVQTGDTTDRGPDSKAVIDLLRGLETEAEAAGGKVVLLLGNHEAMNLLGDWRYVHPGDIEAFGGADARARALSLQGSYGAWIAERDAVARVGDTVFVHGGVAPAFAEKGIEATNAEVRAALRGGDPTALGPDGPLWYRGFVQDPESEACPRLATSLRALGAKRMVVGHTTRRDGRIESRCGGRLHVIDVGISSAYGGNLAAWEVTEGDSRALTPQGAVDLEDPSP